jgi:hypothetical protein
MSQSKTQYHELAECINNTDYYMETSELNDMLANLHDITKVFREQDIIYEEK